MAIRNISILVILCLISTVSLHCISGPVVRKTKLGFSAENRKKGFVLIRLVGKKEDSVKVRFRLRRKLPRENDERMRDSYLIKADGMLEAGKPFRLELPVGRYYGYFRADNSTHIPLVLSYFAETETYFGYEYNLRMNVITGGNIPSGKFGPIPVMIPEFKSSLKKSKQKDYCIMSSDDDDSMTRKAHCPKLHIKPGETIVIRLKLAEDGSFNPKLTGSIWASVLKTCLIPIFPILFGVVAFTETLHFEIARIPAPREKSAPGSPGEKPPAEKKN